MEWKSLCHCKVTPNSNKEVDLSIQMAWDERELWQRLAAVPPSHSLWHDMHKVVPLWTAGAKIAWSREHGRLHDGTGTATPSRTNMASAPVNCQSSWAATATIKLHIGGRSRITQVREARGGRYCMISLEPYLRGCVLARERGRHSSITMTIPDGKGYAGFFGFRELGGCHGVAWP
jgi:hypothetical protein